MSPQQMAAHGLEPRTTDSMGPRTVMFRGPHMPMREDGVCHFDVYRADQVSLTSTLLGGGDWHWRMISVAGEVLIDCGGYTTQSACHSVIELLRHEAASAPVLDSN
jgi:uncharacterized protein YegP (UPF0339 family)